MSFKVHNGYSLPNLSLTELHAFCMRTGELLKKEAVFLYKSKIVSSAVSHFDYYALGLPVRPDGREPWAGTFHPMTWALTDVWNHQKEIKRTQRRDPEYDFDFNVSFIPMPRKILALIYTERNNLRQIWDLQPEVTPYPYWDNADPPPLLSPRTWKTRRKDWNAALGDGVSFGPRSFSFDPIGDLCDIPTAEEAPRHLPPYQDRLLQMAREVSFDEWAKTWKNGEENVKTSWGSFRDAYIEWGDWIAQDEAGKASWRRTQEILAVRLPSGYDSEEFKREIPMTPLSEAEIAARNLRKEPASEPRQ